MQLHHCGGNIWNMFNLWPERQLIVTHQETHQNTFPIQKCSFRRRNMYFLNTSISSTLEQGNQCSGEQEWVGEGDGKAKTGRGSEAKRSRGDLDDDDRGGVDDHADDVDVAYQILCKWLDTRQIEVTSKEREETNPEFKRVLAERAKRLERVKMLTNS